eukprot:52465-Pyramimonas_sp.AAC.1
MMKADGFAVQYTGLRPVGNRGDVPERFRDRVLHLPSWKDIAHALKLPYVEEMWELPCETGPPACPPPSKHPHLMIKEFVEPESPRPAIGARASS